MSSHALLIQADYEALEQIAQMFASASHDIEAMLSIVKDSLENLRGEWIGLGSEAFFSEMDSEVLPATRRLSAALVEASEVTLHIRTIIQEAEAAAAALFEGDGAAPSTEEGKGVLGHVGDFFSGMWAEGVDTVSGIGHAMLHPVETAKGLWYGITHPGEMWEAIMQPYLEDWNNGRPWRAIGRGTLAVVTTVIGTKGADKALKLGRGASAARAVTWASRARSLGRMPIDDAIRLLGRSSDDAIRLSDEAARVANAGGDVSTYTDDLARQSTH